MRDVKVGRWKGYKGLQEWLLGPECRSLVRLRAETALALYQATVTRRSGRLAQSARVVTEVGGRAGDRWVGRLQVTAPYAVAHEFGRNYESALRGDARQAGARDLEKVLRGLGRT